MSKPVIHPPGLITKLPANRFFVRKDIRGGPADTEFPMAFLEAKYFEIIEKLKDVNVGVTVEHLQYAERYTFSGLENFAVIDIYYNKEGFSGAMKTVSKTGDSFVEMIVSRISRQDEYPDGYEPPLESQKTMFAAVRKVSREAGGYITNVVHNKFCDRIFIMTDAECAFLDCFYNSKGVFTNIRPFSTRGGEDARLLSAISALAKEL